MKALAVTATVLGLLASVTAASATPAIPNGKYTCIAGGSRMMLTLGTMQVSGMHYTFTAPTGPVTAGSYAIAGAGYRWTGDVGGLTNDQIVDSGPDARAGNFWLKYKARPTSLPTTLACQRL